MNHNPSDTLPPCDDDSSPRTRPAEADAIGGEMFGPYLLRERIGVGGMGEVWRADQSIPIRRTVAVKLIKAGMDTREVLARFEAERQALALMDHPCIARVFDAGASPLGRPYFAMEYVHGLPITEYCDKRRLDTRARLELFQKVCQGVQHAHQKAVLHRDLKPTNVLVADVDGHPEPKIIDFGVAKATSRKLTDVTMYTSIGQMIGTPEYMSPEQAEFTKEDVDTRTDVYSLGVILYELLVGALPFELAELRGAGLEGMLKVLREEDPPKPSTKLSGLGDRTTQVAKNRHTELKRLSSQLRGDLDWIVMRALEKDRNRRYGSPAELAQDLQRHLDDQPVQAGPPTVGYRMSKFVRRHRAGVAIATASVLGLGAFGITATLQARTIAHERDRATEAADKAAAMNVFLANTLASANPWQGGVHDATVVQALDAAVREIESTFADQPEIEASMRAVIGETYLGLGKLEPATEQLEQAIQMRVELSGSDDLEVGRLRLVEARLRQDLADYQGALRSGADAARIFRSNPSAGVDHLVQAYHYESRNFLSTQQYAAAESILALAEPLLPNLEGSARILSAEQLSQRGDLLLERDGNAAAADSLSRLAFERALSIDPDHATVPIYIGNAAQYRSRSGDYEGALADFDLALSYCEKVYGPDSPGYATCLENRGGVYYQLGRVDETFAALEKVHEIRSRNLGPGHIDVIRTGLNMGAVASIAGDQEKALSIFAELEPILIEARGLDHPDVLAVMRNKAAALRRLARYDESIAVLQQGREIATRMYGDDHPHTARLHTDLGVVYVAADRFADAERAFLAAFRVDREHNGEDHVSTRADARSLVDLYEKWGRPADAAPYRPFVETPDEP